MPLNCIRIFRYLRSDIIFEMIIDKYDIFFCENKENSNNELKELSNYIELISKSSRSLHKFST